VCSFQIDFSSTQHVFRQKEDFHESKARGIPLEFEGIPNASLRLKRRGNNPVLGSAEVL